MIRLHSIKTLSSLSLALVLSACIGQDKAADAGQVPPPPAVNVITVQSSDVALTETLPGRIEASRMAEVRARVTGIVEKRLFSEGSNVEQGQILFEIDDAPYRARYEAALAQQAKAEAALEEADYQAKRYQRLIEQKAISEHELVRANAQQMQAKAQLQAAIAEVTASKIDLDYTQVKAPIAGRIGRELVTEGALVSQASATLLANIQQIDKVYVNFQQSSQALLQRYRANAEGKLVFSQDEGLDVDLILPDGSLYPQRGRLLFSDINVEQGTGQILLRAEMDNPQGLLMPGLFVQVRLTQASLPNAFAVPQRAVMRNNQGDTVMVVDNDNILNVRSVTVAGSVGGKWVITEGLQNGEKLMIDGFQKARPNAPVTPVAVDADKASNKGA